MYLKHCINLQVPLFAAPHAGFGGKDACIRKAKGGILKGGVFRFSENGCKEKNIPGRYFSNQDMHHGTLP